MAIRNIYSAESWSKIYQAFNQINFSAFDYETIKLSIIDYLRIYYPENFNDWIESSELVALIESFAYVAEQLSYRLDMLSHEVFITTAQRKQSILKLAKLVSYKPSRNIPARGLVKITSITTSEKVIDSNNNNLSGINIIWNDQNNANWKEQFYLTINRIITSRFGQFSAIKEVGDVVMQLYTFNNTKNSIANGVHSFTVDTGLESFPMELVPVLLDDNGPYEKTPDINSQLSVIYANDGLGDGSDYTGFLMYAKQGILSQIPYTVTAEIPNRSLDLAPQNVNETDVWVTQVDSDGTIQEIWNQVEVLADQNIAFYNVSEQNRKSSKSRKRFEVETLENDAIKLIFGDGDFSDIPVGSFYFWVRQSANRSIVIPPNKLVNQSLSFKYTSPVTGMIESCSITFSLTSTIQNSAGSEDIEHIRQSAPSTYYSQNRMVNGQDYNTFMLKDQSVLRLNTINRTFAGQPKYIEWNDASGQYQNVKVFGDDLKIGYNLRINSINTGTAVSGRGLIDQVIEPLLSTSGIMNILTHISATNLRTKGVVSYPRTSFIEDNRAIYVNSFSDSSRIYQKEKTLLQGAIDQHWYGEPISYTPINSVNYAMILDPAIHPEDDSNIWLPTIPRTVDGINPFIPGDIGSKLQSKAAQRRFGLAFDRNTPFIGSDVTIVGTLKSRISLDSQSFQEETISFEFASNKEMFFITSNLRGRVGVGEVNIPFTSDILDVLITQDVNASYHVAPGDAFILNVAEVIKTSFTTPAEFDTNSSASNINISKINLLGRWVLIDGINLPQLPNMLPFNPNVYDSAGQINPASWIIWVEAIVNPITLDPIGFMVNYRELTLIVSSQNTKFWYNSNEQIIDPETKHRVFDIIRVLRSNIVTINGVERALARNENYDVIGPVYNSDGTIDLHSLEIVPTDMLNIDSSGDTMPDNLLQFENFVQSWVNTSSNPYYIYYQLETNPIDQSPTTEQVPNTETASLPAGVSFSQGSFVSDEPDINGVYWGRKLQRSILDFMWQHFTPLNNLIDPSVSNIHDAYLLTQGYYDGVSSYLQGKTSFMPNPPTPLELRNQYSNLLQAKMLSDTIVLHPGKIKLLFGALAEPQLRAQFRVIISPSATLTSERIRTEILSVINSYFSINNWDFGDTFYATELIGLIHQRLPTEILSVVLVPTYAVNSFGSLFTVSSGLDEILQSAATIDDIAIITELNTTTLRQGLIA